MPSSNDVGDPLQVYIDDQNTRYVTFANDGLTEQTKVHCRGAVPGACSPNSNSTSDGNCEKISCPCDRAGETQFAYIKKIMDQISPECNGMRDTAYGYRALVIGLGGGSIPEQLLSVCPNNTRVETIEYDQRFLDAATRFFGFKLEAGRNEVYIGDGGEAVRKRAVTGEKYDAIIIDAMTSGFKVPETCSSLEFVKNLKNALQPGGLAVQNIGSEYAKVIQTYQQVFGKDSVDGQDVQFHITHLISAEAPDLTPLGPL